MRGLILPRRVSDEAAPGADFDQGISQVVVPDNVDGPWVSLAYEANAEVTFEARESGRRFGSVSGLSPEHVHKAVNMTLMAAVLTFHHADATHYTQGPERWEGIAHGLRAWKGQFPKHADCSAFATWCLWQGLGHFHHSDTVNGQNWRAGYTGTLLQHGREVKTLIPGDLVIYGTSWPGEHTAVYTGGGLVVSDGSEGGPYLLPVHYRSDVLSYRRYI